MSGVSGGDCDKLQNQEMKKKLEFFLNLKKKRQSA